MRATIDAAGRVVIPKPLRERLGFTPGTELEIEAVDSRLEITAPSRVSLQNGPHGAVFIAEAAPALTAESVRDILETGRR